MTPERKERLRAAMRARHKNDPASPEVLFVSDMESAFEQAREELLRKPKRPASSAAFDALNQEVESLRERLCQCQAAYDKEQELSRKNYRLYSETCRKIDKAEKAQQWAEMEAKRIAIKSDARQDTIEELDHELRKANKEIQKLERRLKAAKKAKAKKEKK